MRSSETEEPEGLPLRLHLFVGNTCSVSDRDIRRSDSHQGAVLCMEPVASETSKAAADTISRLFTETARLQVQYVSSDDPTSAP